MASLKKNQKLCWNCEGEVDKDAIVCLFCGADLSEQGDIPPPSPYRAIAATLPDEAQSKEKAPTKEEGTSAIALFFLLPGIIFLLFSLLLVFFSTDGILTFQWHSRTWYLYFITSLPLFYFGYRLL